MVGDRESKALIELSDKQPGTLLGVATGVALEKAMVRVFFHAVLFLLENAVWQKSNFLGGKTIFQ